MSAAIRRTAQSFCVPAADIAAAGYDLSLNRYKEVEHEDIAYDPPEKIISELARDRGRDFCGAGQA